MNYCLFNTISKIAFELPLDEDIDDRVFMDYVYKNYRFTTYVKDGRAFINIYSGWDYISLKRCQDWDGYRIHYLKYHI